MEKGGPLIDEKLALEWSLKAGKGDGNPDVGRVRNPT